MRHTTLLMVLLALFIGLGGFMLNFDIGYTGSVLVMRPFNDAFGHCVTKPGSKILVCALSATQQSVGSSIYLIFLAIGSGLSGISSNWVGPRGGLQVGCIFIIIGAAGMVGSTGNFTAYVACKCIGAVGLGHIQTMGATYGVDCAPSRKRGLLVALYTTGANIGNLVSSCVCLSSQHFATNWSWQTPIICQIPVAVIFGGGLFIFPQSPRWLLTKEKTEKARKSFARLYNRDPASEEVARQLEDTQMAISEEKELSSSTNWTEIFHRNFIRRTLIALAINICASLSGAFFIFSYTAIFLKGVGISSPIEISVIINSCVVVGGITGPVWVEYIGRRRTLLAGYSGMAVCMLTFSAVSTGLGGVKTAAARGVLIAFLCGWAFIFGGFISSTQFMASAEMHAVRHRTYAQAFTSMIGNVFSFAASFWGPYMLNVKYGNMGTNVGYFYFGLEFLALILLFLIVPENARLTLEQIDEYFTSGRKAWKTSLARNKRIAKNEISIKDD
ncbi:general substrate transporter [Hyaloscypha variabilis]